MVSPRTIRIDDIEYVRKDDFEITNTTIKIVVLDRGFVYVGKPEIHIGVNGHPDFLLINEAKNIRQWGTTRGLAELVDGPTNKTTLDGTITVWAPLSALLQIIDVNQNQWKKHI